MHVKDESKYSASLSIVNWIAINLFEGHRRFVVGSMPSDGKNSGRNA